MNQISAVGPMTMEKGNMPKMENSMQFGPTMSMPVMPMMSRNGANMNLGRESARRKK
jgi:hypothetical protein